MADKATMKHVANAGNDPLMIYQVEGGIQKQYGPIGPGQALNIPLSDEELLQVEADLAVLPASTLVELRSQRDGLLTACDWTQLPDTPIDDATKQAWTTYRQQLRDWPNQKKFDPLNPPAWPEPPA